MKRCWILIYIVLATRRNLRFMMQSYLKWKLRNWKYWVLIFLLIAPLSSNFCLLKQLLSNLYAVDSNFKNDFLNVFFKIKLEFSTNDRIIKCRLQTTVIFRTLYMYNTIIFTMKYQVHVISKHSIYSYILLCLANRVHFQ